MALLSVNDLTFSYEGSYENVFEHLSFQVDTSWRLGLVGRNGRGKTTLLRLLSGELDAKGRIDAPCAFSYFPFEAEGAERATLDVLGDISLGAPEWRLRRELTELSVVEDALYRPYSSLSRGEQTKAQLAALFSREDAYMLIDEPTNHLDLRGREMVGDYLRKKDGFLLVSHDRAFLNRCIDHVLSLNRATVTVQRGDFDVYERELEAKNRREAEENRRLAKDIDRLQSSARRAAGWSERVEKGKYHVAESDVASVDKGYIGARSAAMMKRSKAIQQRRQRAAEEKSKLLKDVERVGELKLRPLEHPKRTLITLNGASVAYDGAAILDNLSFTVSRGERVALTGQNGAGKSSILKALCGLSDALKGDIRKASGLKISYVPQDASHIRGSMRDFIAESGVDETLFKAILRNMDFGRGQFDKDMAELSQGQKKKALIAGSLCEQAHIYIWDEPMNYIDVLSRMQIERLICTFEPTMLMVEHDAAFISRVCNKEISLDALRKPALRGGAL